LAAGILAFAMSVAWAQDTSTPDSNAPSQGSAPSSGTPQDKTANQQGPAPAYGQENAPPPITETPPLSGLDVPSLEPHAAPLSYLQPGGTVSETADTNANNSLGGGSLASVTRALGSLTLQRLWSHFDLALDYIGGVSYYDLPGQGFKALQQMDFEQKITWKRGQFAVRDSFSYLPEGNFGGAYGSLGSQEIESLGNTSFSYFFGGGNLGTLGLAPRVLNVSLADVSEYLSPKSAVTAAGGYAFTHFYGNDIGTGGPFIGTSQVSGQVGYSRLLTPKTQVAMAYGYQGFDFSVFGTAFHSDVIPAMYGHQISGRMDLLIAAGPQITFIGTPGLVCSSPPPPGSSCTSFVVGTVKDTRIGVAGQARLRYKFTKTMLSASYQRFETSGSGLFAGAQTDIGRVSAERPLSRVWTGSIDAGFSRNARLQTASGGVAANNYYYGYGGAALHRSFGHDFHGFASYQFNELHFDNSLCGTASACSRISNRNAITIGLDWTPRPIRID
jgi:hypothetical protein